MILLNGVPAIVGMGLIHITAINVLAIIIEYGILKSKYSIPKLLLRTIVANLISLMAGLTVLVLLPEYMNGNIMHTESTMTNYDRFSLLIGLVGLFLANVLIELPAYIIGIKNNKVVSKQLFKTVLYANLLSNIPVFILYGLLAI